MKKWKGDDSSRRLTDVVPFGLSVVGGWMDGRKKLEDWGGLEGGCEGRVKDWGAWRWW